MAPKTVSVGLLIGINLTASEILFKRCENKEYQMFIRNCSLIFFFLQMNSWTKEKNTNAFENIYLKASDFYRIIIKIYFLI